MQYSSPISGQVCSCVFVLVSQFILRCCRTPLLQHYNTHLMPFYKYMSKSMSEFVSVWNFPKEFNWFASIDREFNLIQTPRFVTHFPQHTFYEPNTFSGMSKNWYWTRQAYWIIGFDFLAKMTVWSIYTANGSKWATFLRKSWQAWKLQHIALHSLIRLFFNTLESQKKLAKFSFSHPHFW